ncbi:MAG: MarR family winged helix-turn-helix transcriptional regulator [Christensenellales bacterium]|jgi:DNA-binding MarR family transcriptional regulator
MHRRLMPEEMPIGMLINDLSHYFHNRMRQEGSRAGMRDGYRNLLFHLAKQDAVSQQDLVRQTHLKAPTVSVALQKMEADGLVERRTHADDLRQSWVYLTDKGRELNHTMQLNVQRTEKDLVAPLSPQEREQLQQLLAKIHRSLINTQGDKEHEA